MVDVETTCDGLGSLQSRQRCDYRATAATPPAGWADVTRDHMLFCRSLSTNRRRKFLPTAFRRFSHKNKEKLYLFSKYPVTVSDENVATEGL